ncbi:MAG: FAD-binding protein, partial [Desulfobacterales bacterium]|nr:FAD-binding protein [Desulfobacterales bacterium]
SMALLYPKTVSYSFLMSVHFPLKRYITRPAVDEGWANLETMIGQTGKMISPELYIGVGLSGDLQHMVEIVDAKVMVAVNNDPGSPVFKQVDYGIVDDCREFVPLLIKKIKEHLEKRVTC